MVQEMWPLLKLDFHHLTRESYVVESCSLQLILEVLGF